MPDILLVGVSFREAFSLRMAKYGVTVG